MRGVVLAVLLILLVGCSSSGVAFMPNPATDSTPGDVTAPVAPSSLVISAYGKGLMITIIAIAPVDLDHFELHRGLSSFSTTLYATGNTSTFTDLNTSYGTTYYYRARMIDTSGNLGAFSSTTSATPAQWVGGDIGNGEVGTTQIADLSVSNAKIVDLAVSTAKIGDLQVTQTKIGLAAIDEARIGDLEVSTIKIRDNAVTLPVTSSNTSLQVTGDPPGTYTFTGISVTITTTGRPLWVNGHANFQFDNSAGNQYAMFKLVVAAQYGGAITVTSGSAGTLMPYAGSGVGTGKIFTTIPFSVLLPTGPVGFPGGPATYTFNILYIFSIEAGVGYTGGVIHQAGASLEIVELRK